MQLSIAERPNLGERGKAPLMSPLPKRDWWVLREQWTTYGYIVNENFVTDMASVPRIPFIYSKYKGYARRSGILHDFLYVTCLVSRYDADLIFYYSMLDEGVPKCLAYQMFLAVRLLGESRYRRFSKYRFSDRAALRTANVVNGVPVFEE